MSSRWWDSTKKWILQRLWNAIVDYGLAAGFGFMVTFVSGLVSGVSFFYLIIAASIVGLIVSTIVTQFEPHIRARRVKRVITDYQNHKTLSLYEAACLWVGVEPHYPLKNSDAIAKLSFLKSVIRSGHLSCQWKTGIEIMSELTGGKHRRLSPDDDQPVSMVAMRKYADTVGDVPAFLEKVSVPSTEENK